LSLGACGYNVRAEENRPADPSIAAKKTLTTYGTDRHG
jgi:hypothetical protein